ncbi:MAG: TonB-dependent receptor [Sphingomonadales bacterium]|nr:MAG: TonB-dependent receptor [Sphingomonadales bacterium]
MKKLELLAATALTVFFATPAMAQDATPAAAPQEAVSETLGSDEIIVTATKRETTLIDTPISVAVVGSDAIEKAQIRDLIDLQTIVPSLRVSQLQSSANTNFIIRGFGNGANNAGIEPSVGVFIDGVYRSRSAAQIGDLPDLERIEVLRGPQSTLFGKNASAGIISIVTARPSFERRGVIEASYGNYNAIVLKGSVSGPLTENIAASLSGNYNRRDGYVRDMALNQDVNDRNRWGVRGQLLFEPSSDLSIRLIGDYDKIDENCCAVANLIDGPTGAAVRGLGGRLDSNNPFSYRVYNNRLSSNKINNWGVSGQIDYDFGGVNLTSITSYRGVKLRTDQDSDFTSADLIGNNANRTDIKTFTQELRLASNFDGPLNFLIGGFYFNERIHVEDDITFGNNFRGYANILSGGAIGQVEGILGVPANTFFRAGQGLFDRFRYKNEAGSLFGQVDFEPVDGLTFTAGLNYTKDKKRVSSNVTSTDSFSALDFVAIGRSVITQQGIATTVGQLLGLNRLATAQEVGAFAQLNPAGFAQVQAGAAAFAAANQSNPAVNPLLGLRPLQFLPPFLNFPNSVESGKTSDDDLAYTLRVNYKITPRLSAYATYGTGFKASSFNLSRDSRPLASDFIPGSPVTNPGASPIRTAGLAVPNLTTGSRFAGPENATVYEVGLKAQFPRFAFNLAVFKQILEGFQSNVFTGTGFALANAAKQSTTGFEFDTSLNPVDPLTFTFSVTYLDAIYDDFTNSSAGNVTGTRPSGVPEWSYTAGLNYAHDLGGGNTLTFRGDYHHESKVLVIDLDPRFTREVNTANAALILGLDNGLELSVWGRNIFNDKHLITAFPSVAQSGSYSGYPNQPRTYGGTARFRF